jgi:hypothetical protein
MKRSHALVCVSLLAAMVGCDVVTVDAPIGDDPSPVFVPVLMRELGISPRGVSEGGA